MGAHHRKPTPIACSPGREYVNDGLLLIFGFGMALVGIQESYQDRSWSWFWAFVAGGTTIAVVYFWIVWLWVDWTIRTGDYRSVDGFVDCLHEYDHHPGQD